MKLSTLFFVLVFTSLSFAGETGTIAGKVTDKDFGEPLTRAIIRLEGTSFETSTARNGGFKMSQIPPGTYTLITYVMGYNTKKVKNVRVVADSTTVINVAMEPARFEGKEVIVTAEHAKVQMDRTSSMALSVLAPAFIGQSNEFFVPHNTEEYSRIYESGFLEVLNNPLSTFAADVDAASYGNVRRFITNDQMPPKDAVRLEELVNYFSYDYEPPRNDHPLSINLEYADCPWEEKYKLIHIGLQGETLATEDQKPSNLVFLLDVSGSMNSPKKLPLLQRSFKLLVEQLGAEDRIAIVVYAGTSGLVLPATPGSEKKEIIAALDKLQAGGSTAGGAGIKLAYKTAKENFIKGGNNRVILATDGDFNVGISSTSELVRFVEEKRDDGIFLTVLGFGAGNYKDDRLQELADRGNGNHAYIDNILEAKKVLVNEITSTLYTIAKDVKIQVEFNPAKIHSYRLLGYENRRLEDKDFEDDKKDAGEIGAGHTVTALYEVVPVGAETASTQRDLKYQEVKIKDGADASSDLMTVRIRYKKPDGKKSIEFSKVLQDEPVAAEKSSDNFCFSACVAEYAMILRDSEFRGTSSLDHVLKLAKAAKGDDKFGYRAEFINLVERTKMLMKD
jgi:Ca-activated chloride channel homolog